MSRIRHTSKSFALLAALVLSFAAIGCSQDSVVAPAVTDSDYGNMSTPNGDPTIQSAMGFGTLVSATNGGVVDNGRVRLEFPPGALNEDTYITMRMVGSSNLEVAFGPEGLEFNSAVTMKLDLEGTEAEGDAENTPIMYWNPSTSEWDEITNLTPEHSNESKALVEHFSKYGGINGYHQQ